MKYLTICFAAVLAAGNFASAANAQSLAGQEGNKRYPPQFPSSPKDPCKLAYKAYVAASGHSAYAQTTSGRTYQAEAFFCGIARNAPSIKAAEERALADCKSLSKKYKMRTLGACSVYASK